MYRIHSLDYLKLLLAVLVAFGHTYWLQSHMSALVFAIGNGAMRVMVPAFCIMAGYFLHSAAMRGAGVRWLYRVLGLYMFWMLIYVPFWLNEVDGLTSLIKTLLLGYYHLWFMAGILVAGFLLLALRRLSHLISYQLEVPVLIAAAEEDHPGPTFLVGDLAELDLPARGVEAEEQRDVQVVRVARPGGRGVGERALDQRQIELLGQPVAEVGGAYLGNAQTAGGNDQIGGLHHAAIGFNLIAAIAFSIGWNTSVS